MYNTIIARDTPESACTYHVVVPPSSKSDSSFLPHSRRGEVSPPPLSMGKHQPVALDRLGKRLITTFPIAGCILGDRQRCHPSLSFLPNIGDLVATVTAICQVEHARDVIRNYTNRSRWPKCPGVANEFAIATTDVNRRTKLLIRRISR